MGAPNYVPLERAVRTIVRRYDSTRAAAIAIGVDPAYLHRLMHGEKTAPSAKTLKALGLREVRLYTEE